MDLGSDWVVDEDKFFEPGEQALLQEHVRNRKRRTRKREPWLDWFLVELAFQTGLRVGEMADICCGDFYVDAHRPGVAVRNGKGDKRRYVRISQSFCTSIRQFMQWKVEAGEPIQRDSPVFASPSHDGSVTVRALQKRFARILDELDIVGHSLHHCRHTYATALNHSSGGNLRLVQKQLGHSKITTTQVYANVYDTSAQAAVDKLYRFHQVTTTR